VSGFPIASLSGIHLHPVACPAASCGAMVTGFRFDDGERFMDLMLRFS
jgi:hypothetical protein